MKIKQRFYLSVAIFQILLIIIAMLVINGLIGITTAQGETVNNYDTNTAGIIAISAAVAIAGATLAAGMTIKTVGTAAISALTENEGVFFKAFLVIALGEALAIYGLIVAILLWIKIPTI
ncbi:MAG: ATP synthase subunit C [Promethearchaeota archaeon]